MENGFFKKNKILGIALLYILSLLPLIVFGYYKNGLLVYQHGFISFFSSLQYLVIPVIIIILSYVFETYYYIVVKKENNLHNVFNSVVPYINTLCYLVCAPMDYLWITIPIIVFLDILLKFVGNRVSVNQIALFQCVLFGILTALGMFQYANLYEASLSNEITDPSLLFIGKGVGAIGTTSTLCVLIGYVLLLFNSYYKKDIPIISFIGYAIVSIIIYFVGGLTFTEILVNTFASGFIFAAVFVSSLSTATPVIRSGRVLYGLLIGVLSAVSVHILHFYVGIYFVILVLGFLVPLFDKFKLSLGE